MARDYGQTVRVAVGVLSALVLLQVFLMYAQHRQIRDLARVDCTALAEREQRVSLYSDLITYWDEEDRAVADAYRRQQKALLPLVDAGRLECESDRG